MSQEVERVRWDEQRKTMQQDAQTKAELSKYEDQLARWGSLNAFDIVLIG